MYRRNHVRESHHTECVGRVSGTLMSEPGEGLDAAEE